MFRSELYAAEFRWHHEITRKTYFHIHEFINKNTPMLEVCVHKTWIAIVRRPFGEKQRKILSQCNLIKLREGFCFAYKSQQIADSFRATTFKTLKSRLKWSLRYQMLKWFHTVRCVSQTSVINRHKRANDNFHRSMTLELPTARRQVPLDIKRCQITIQATCSHHRKHVNLNEKLRASSERCWSSETTNNLTLNKSSPDISHNPSIEEFPSRLSKQLQMIGTWLFIHFSDHTSVNIVAASCSLFTLVQLINQWNILILTLIEFQFFVSFYRVMEWCETSFWGAFVEFVTCKH
jgi:hypothetical protein